MLIDISACDNVPSCVYFTENVSGQIKIVFQFKAANANYISVLLGFSVSVSHNRQNKQVIEIPTNTYLRNSYINMTFHDKQIEQLEKALNGIVPRIGRG